MWISVGLCLVRCLPECSAVRAGKDVKAVGRSEFPRAVASQMSASGSDCLSARRVCSRALIRFFATAVLCKNR